MKQPITGFEQDDDGDWLARLQCGHTQHVRHRPPLEERPWVLRAEAREQMLDTKLNCLFCDMPQLPPGASEYKATAVFTEDTVPKGLLKDHQTRPGTWGVIRVIEGKLLYEIAGSQRWVLRPGVDGVIEPEAKHHVRPLGNVRFQVSFFRLPVAYSERTMRSQEHWQAVYEHKQAEKVSWYRPHLEQSLAMLDKAGLANDARILDVGGGASTFVDDLLKRGFSNVAVVDIAEQALAISQHRLGSLAYKVDWIVGDATTPLLEPNSVDFWHDRAVFHFLGEPEARKMYCEQLARCLRPDGHVMIATFGLDGPEKCSGLPVTRYDADGISEVLGKSFERLAVAKELHQTPGGATQSFIYCLFRRIA